MLAFNYMNSTLYSNGKQDYVGINLEQHEWERSLRYFTILACFEGREDAHKCSSAYTHKNKNVNTETNVGHTHTSFVTCICPFSLVF